MPSIVSTLFLGFFFSYKILLSLIVRRINERTRRRIELATLPLVCLCDFHHSTIYEYVLCHWLQDFCNRLRSFTSIRNLICDNVATERGVSQPNHHLASSIYFRNGFFSGHVNLSRHVNYPPDTGHFTTLASPSQKIGIAANSNRVSSIICSLVCIRAKC